MSDRSIAYKILLKIELEKAYSNIVLDSILSNSATESSAFVSNLVYGVIERKITLDYFLSKYLTKSIKKTDPKIITILRMGTYQIKYMDSVPDFAAVNESVKLTKKIKCGYASGLVNSVLRKVISETSSLPETDNKIYDLSIRYSCPEALVEQYVNDYGVENAEGILSSSLGASPVILRVNTLKTTDDELIDILKNEGIFAEKSDIIENCLVLKKSGAVFETEAYSNGLFHVQDTASQICIKTLAPQPNDIVFDVCSAPGGKTFTIAENMNNIGKICAFDLYEHRIKLVENGAKRLGISIISGEVGDATQFNDTLPQADRVLCDVVCSGTGVIGRKPEIRYKDLSFVDNLTEIQYNILECSSKYLKSKGTLVYSTCSLSKKENQEVCDRFLSEHPNFTKVTLSEEDGYLTLLPHIHKTDGFFIAKFIKE